MRNRVLLAIPVLVFLALSAIFALRGRPGAWHARCEESWRKQDWSSIQSLARNLEHLGTPDAETDYFAALAAHQMKETENAINLAQQWRKRKALNWNWERDLAEFAASQSLAERIGFYRARATIAMLILLAPLNLLSLRRPPWAAGSSLISCLGILLLLL